MKRILLAFFAVLFSASIYAQGVFTVVYADSYDGLVNVRTAPSPKASIVTKIYTPSHGLGEGVLLGQSSGKWVKVAVGRKTGWANSGYLGRQTWYTGRGRTRLVAAASSTRIYGEDYSGEGGLPLFATVKKGTIIADQYSVQGNYYVLSTAHDNLYVPKSQVRVVYK